MRWIKAILLVVGGLVVLCLLLIGFVLLTFDTDDYRRLAARGVTHITGYDVAIDGPFVMRLSSEPSLHARSIRFVSRPGEDPPPVASIGTLRIRIALWPLFRRTLVVKDLLVADVRMAIPLDTAAGLEAHRGAHRKPPPDIALPVLERVQLHNIQLDVVDETAHRTIEVRLRQFAIDDIRDSGPLFIEGDGSISGTEFRIDGQMGAVADLFSGTEPYPLALAFTFGGFDVSVSGTVEDFLGGKGLALQLSGAAGDFSNAFKLLNIDAPPLGSLKFDAAFSRDLAAPKVSDLLITLTGDARLEARIAGGIDNGFSREGTDLRFTGHCSNSEVFAWLLPGGLPEVREVRVSGDVRDAGGTLALEDLSVRVDAEQGLTADVTGRVGLDEAFRFTDLGLTVAVSMPTTEVLRTYAIADLPEIGPLSVRGQLTGPLNAPAMETVALEWGGTGPVRVTSRGRIGRLPGKDDADRTASGIDLGIELGADHTRSLNAAFGLNLPDLGTVSATARITGASNRFQLDGIRARTDTAGGVRIDLEGAVAVDASDDRGLVWRPDLRARIAAPSVVSAAALIGIPDLPDLKPLQASARIEGSPEALGLRDIAIRAGHSGPVRFDITGAVDRIPLIENPPVSGVRLRTSVAADSTAAIGDMLGLPVPDLGTVNGRFEISGSLEGLTVSEAEVTAASARGLAITATGGIQRVRVGDSKPFQGIDLSLSGTAPGLTALPGLSGRDFPDLWPLHLTARVTDRSGSLDVEAIDLRSASNRETAFHLKGQLRHVDALERATLNATMDAASQPWVEALLQRTEVMNMPLTGTVRLSGLSDGVHIDEFRLTTAAGDALSISARGRLDKLSESPRIALELDLDAPDPPSLGAMTGISLPPFRPMTVTGRLDGNPETVGFSGTVRFGGTAFDATIGTRFSGSRPRIDADFKTAVVALEDIGVVPKPPEATPVVGPSPRPATRNRFFSDTPWSFDVLKRLDVHAALDAGKLVSRNVAIENLDLDIRIENGRMRIHPANMTYAAGFTDFDVVVDASGPTPEMHLKITADDIDIEEVLARAHEPLILNGNLTLFVDLQTSGRSARDIASNLNGQVGVVLENGEIRRIVNFLAADALDLVLTTADRRQFTRLNCLVGKIQFRDGVGDVEHFVMDTPRIRATMAGILNLGAETIDIAVNPQQKRRLLRRQGSAVRISGPMANPAFRVLPLSEAMQLYGKLAVPPVFLSERVLGNLWYLVRRDGDASPCLRDGQ